MMARKMTEDHHLQFTNPYGNSYEEDFGITDDDANEEDFMSPLPPQLKRTFVDKLPSWSETSKVNSLAPDTYLNVNVTSSAASMMGICILTFFVKTEDDA